jgi:hypothetical protein
MKTKPPTEVTTVALAHTMDSKATHALGSDNVEEAADTRHCDFLSSCFPAERADEDEGDYCKGGVLAFLDENVCTPVINFLYDIASYLGIYPTRYSEVRAVSWFLEKHTGNDFEAQPSNEECYAAYQKLPAEVQKQVREAVFSAQKRLFLDPPPESKAPERQRGRGRREEPVIELEKAEDHIEKIESLIKENPYELALMQALHKFLDANKTEDRDQV